VVGKDIYTLEIKADFLRHILLLLLLVFPKLPCCLLVHLLVLKMFYNFYGKVEIEVFEGKHMYISPEIVKTVKLGRLRWLGHLTRANETSP
jgi:hypothetical protein